MGRIFCFRTGGYDAPKQTDQFGIILLLTRPAWQAKSVAQQRDQCHPL